jgi:ribonucleotide monophosphatase NagD (HAD superfamily)
MVGKPEPGIILEGLSMLGAAPEDTAMIGDGITLDIPAGHRAGTATILLLSGITSSEELAGAAIQPDAVYPDIAALLADVRGQAG